MRLVGDEECVEVAGQEPGRSRLVHNNVHDVFAIEVPGLPQEGLLTMVVVLGFVFEFPVKRPIGLRGILGAIVHPVKALAASLISSSEKLPTPREKSSNSSRPQFSFMAPSWLP